MTGKRCGPGLGPEDRALWDEVKKSVKPLRRSRVLEPLGVEAEISAPQRGQRVPAARPAPLTPGKPAKPVPPPLAKLDRRSKSRVARGRIEIDARLDLHGMTLERARTRLAGFLREAQSRDYALVLVITGKGASGRGALKHEVPQWLALAEFRTLVIGFEEAAANHGGSGALYVRIRRART